MQFTSKSVTLLILLFFSSISNAQPSGLITRNLEATLSDSTESVVVVESGRVYKTERRRVVERTEGSKTIHYKFFANGKRVTHMKKDQPYLQQIFIDSIKFKFFKYAYFDSDSIHFTYHNYDEVYKSLLSSIDSVKNSRIYQIITTKKLENPIVEVQFYNDAKDTIFTSKSNAFVTVDSLESNAVEYSYFDEKGSLKKRERYMGGLITYSYSAFGELEMFFLYEKNNLLSEYSIKPLAKKYFTKHYKFIYNKKNELTTKIDMLSGEKETYIYSYKKKP